MLASIARPKVQASVTWSPIDDRWYRAIGGARADSGPVVVPESALSIAAVYRAVNVLAHSVASIPLVVYERIDGDGKQKAREHPGYDLLHDRPNAWMTSFRWRHLAMTQGVLWGNHYSQIMPGPGGIGGLVPLSPDTTRLVDQLRDGRLVYVTRDTSAQGFGPERRLLQDEVFHLRGFSIDGKSGIPLTRAARNAMGLALTAERHGSMFLKKGARHAGFLYSETPMKDDVRKANAEEWQKQYGGEGGTGTTPVLSALKFQQVTANNRDSQWLEARTFQVEEILRFLGVPGVLCGYADKTATYASAEQFFLSFVTHTVRPWTENFSQELNASVVVDSPDYFADFILEGLLKGDIKTRYTAHQLAISSGWKNRNEVRVEEDYNKGPAELDEFIMPMNMMVAGEDPEEPTPRAAPKEPDVPPRDEARAHLSVIARKTVERLVRKETAAIAGAGGKKGAAARFAGNPDGWKGWLASFYAEHAARVSDDLAVPITTAERYCADQRARFESLENATESAEAESIAALLRLTPAA